MKIIAETRNAFILQADPHEHMGNEIPGRVYKVDKTYENFKAIHIHNDYVKYGDMRKDLEVCVEKEGYIYLYHNVYSSLEGVSKKKMVFELVSK